MATEIYKSERLSLTRFWGGDDRGIGVQLTARTPMYPHETQEGYVRLTREEALDVGLALIKFGEAYHD